jgi:hypothetical protein
MKYPFLISVFIFSGFVFNCFSQSDSSRSSHVTVTYSKVGYKRVEKDKGIFNLIKINPLLIFNGDIPIYWERRIKDQVSVEAGLGFTHMDYVNNIFTLSDQTGNLEVRNAKPGYSLMIAAKYYPSKFTKALDDIYFGPEIRYRKYNTEVEDCSPTSLTGFVAEDRTLIDFKLNVGYIYYLSDRVIVDFYGGIGMRSRNINSSTCNNSRTAMISTHINDMVPVISAGIKLGFGF